MLVIVILAHSTQKMSSINWKYEKQVLFFCLLIFIISLIVTLVLTTIVNRLWTCITGLVLTSVFSVINYYFLIYLTSFLLKTNFNKFIMMIFFTSRFLIYAIPVAIIVAFKDYFNVFSGIIGLITPFLAVFAANIYDIFVLRRKKSNE